MKKNVLEMKGIQNISGSTSIRWCDFIVEEGSVHALMGEMVPENQH